VNNFDETRQNAKARNDDIAGDSKKTGVVNRVNAQWIQVEFY
jgi:hypothetical protein